MASKKYFLLAGLFSLLSTSALLGQTPTPTAMSGTGNYDYLDTAYIPASRMDQQRSFMANQSIFPAKPRDMWVLGLNGGLYMVGSNINPLPGWSAGINVRKSLGYVFSLRLGYNYGEAKGGNVAISHQYDNLPAPLQAEYATQGTGFVENYEMKAQNLSLDMLISLNNIMFHRAESKVNVYALVGYDLLLYHTTINQQTSSGNIYDYSGIDFTQKRGQIRSALKSLETGTYTTDALFQHRTPNLNQDPPKWSPRHSLDAGAGVAFKLSPRVSLNLEEKLTMPFDVYLTGAPVNEEGSKIYGQDIPSYTSIGINFALGNAAKRMQPLWWVNPLDYAYTELNAPHHMKIPTPVLPDADGDGVTDQFDRCPNTPAGVQVDVHGCPLDTDGDGVPDYKDKQLITPTYCQPVDADGVGKCPDPECCKNIQPACNLGYLPSVMFKGRAVTIPTDAQSNLDNVASQMKQNPNCKVVVTGHAEASKASEQLSWDRVNAVITYLTEKEGISGDRLIFVYSGEPGDTKTVDFRVATASDNGPNTVPPPHPNLMRKR
jgi:OOP family OmpA-OmpF porin